MCMTPHPSSLSPRVAPVLFAPARGETSELVCNHFLKKLFTIFFGRDRRHSGVKLSGAPLEAGDVFGIVVGSLIVPTTPHYSLPFEGQCADGRVVAFTSLDLQLVIAPCPSAKLQGTLGHLVKGLSHEFRTSPAHVNPELFAAGLLDRRDATETAHRLSVGKALSLRAPGDGQTRCQGRAGSRKTLPQSKVSVGAKKLGDLLFVAEHNRIEGGQLLHQAL